MSFSNTGDFARLRRTDIWLIIFEYLDSRSFHNSIPRVSKRFQSLYKVHALKILHISLSIDQALPKVISSNLASIAVSINSEKQLYLGKINPFEITPLEKLSLFSNSIDCKVFQIFTYFERLHYLKVSGKTKLIESLFALSFKCLKVFKVCVADSELSPLFIDTLTVFLDVNPIEHFSIKCCRLTISINQMMSNNSTIKKLHIYSIISDPMFYQSLYGKDFKSLKLKTDYSSMADCFYFLNACTSLEKLSLEVPGDLSCFLIPRSFLLFSSNSLDTESPFKLQRSVIEKLVHLEIIIKSGKYGQNDAIAYLSGPSIQTLKLQIDGTNYFDRETVKKIIFNNKALTNLVITPDIDAATMLSQPEDTIIENLADTKREIRYNYINIGHTYSSNTLELNSLVSQTYSNYLSILKVSKKIAINEKTLESLKIIIRESKSKCYTLPFSKLLQDIHESSLKISEINPYLVYKLLNHTKNILNTLNFDIKTATDYLIFKQLLLKNSIRVLSVKYIELRYNPILTYLGTSSVKKIKYYAINNKFGLLRELLETCYKVQKLTIVGPDYNNYITCEDLHTVFRHLNPCLRMLKIKMFALGKKSLVALENLLSNDSNLTDISLDITSKCKISNAFHTVLKKLHIKKRYRALKFVLNHVCKINFAR
jgi:hypothetical protein